MLTLLRNRKVQRNTAQVLFLAVLLSLILSAVLIARENIIAQGMNSGFAFFERTTGVNIGFSTIQYDANSTYGRLILVGIVNTVILGLLGIVLAGLVGLLVGMMSISRNGSLNSVARLYVEIFRNVPLILQALFWYAIVTHLPSPRNAYHPMPGVFVSSRGLFVPGMNISGEAMAVAMGVFLLGLAVFVVVLTEKRIAGLEKKRRKTLSLFMLAATLVAIVVVLALGRLPDTPLFSTPQLKGLNFRGGLTIPPELSSLAIAIALYGGAYVSEILRAGFLSVPKGQLEAATALGLRPWNIFIRVRLPLAFRAVLPTLTNQCVWLFKATTLGIAVGYSDLFYVISVSITQSGQTLELIGILMLSFLIMNNAISFLLNRINKAIALKGNQLRS